MRRALCLQTRYLDPVEQERAKTTAFQYLNERWTFGDENLETSRWLILSKRPDDKKDRIVRHIQARVSELKQRERLNVYKIAQLGNTFRWRLKEAGVDENYVETLTTLLVARAR